MKSYWQILRQPQISLLLLIGMIARLPHSALSMLLLLHLVNNLDQSWVSAGLVTAVMTLGIAIGGVLFSGSAALPRETAMSVFDSIPPGGLCLGLDSCYAEYPNKTGVIK